MSASFQSPRACTSAICIPGAFVSVETAGSVGLVDFEIRKQARPSHLIRTLSERSPSSQGRTGNWAGTVKRAVTPDRFRTGRPCRTPKPFAAINNLGRCLNGGSFSSSRIKPRKQSRGCFFLRLHRLLCAVDHLTNSAGLTGLVAHCDGHTVSEKEKACPTRDGSKMTQNGAIVS